MSQSSGLFPAFLHPCSLLSFALDRIHTLKHLLPLLILLVTFNLTLSTLPAAALPAPEPLPAIFHPPSSPAPGGAGSPSLGGQGNIALALSSQAQRLLHPPSSSSTSSQSALPHAQPQQDWGPLELLDLVLISTVDGSLHAVERSSGQILWTRPAGTFGIGVAQPPEDSLGRRAGLIDAQYRDGLFDVEKAQDTTGKGLLERKGEPLYIVEPGDGQLYVYIQGDDAVEGTTEGTAEGSGNLQKLPLTMEQLIDLSPFTFPHESSHVFIGSKTTSLRAIDLKTGQDLSAFGPGNSKVSGDAACPPKSSFKGRRGAAGDDDEEDDEHCKTSIEDRPEDKLFIGQQVLDLNIHSHLEGLLQRLRLSRIVPNAIHRDLASYWERSGNVKGESYVKSRGRPSPEVGKEKYSGGWKNKKEDEEVELESRWRVEGMHDGTLVGFEQDQGMKWFVKLDSVAISIFDVLLPTAPGSHPILLPQPPAHIPSLFPSQAHTLQLISQPPSTFISPIMSSAIALIGDNSTSSSSQSSSTSSTSSGVPHIALSNGFYAMSSRNYPLVAFAPKASGPALSGSHVIQDAVKERLPFLLEAGDSKESDRASAMVHIEPETRALQAEGVVVGWVLEQMGNYQAMALIAVLATSCLYLWFSKRGVQTPVAVLEPSVSPSNGDAQQTTPEQPTEAGAGALVLANGSPGTIDDARILSGEASLSSNNGNGSEVVSSNGKAKGEQGTKKPNGRRRKRGRKHKDQGGDGGDEEDGEPEREEEQDIMTLISKKTADLPVPEAVVAPVVLAPVAKEPKLAQEIKDSGLVVSEDVLGLGSHGTVVYKGQFQGRAVAVKRLLQDFVTVASQEVSLLQASDDHQNVIRYFYQEKRGNFLYIALELCPASLADIVDHPECHQDLAVAFTPKKALYQITAGLRHLHSLKIVHRDLKPQNVLISVGKSGVQRMLLSDFGLAKRLDHGQSSYLQTGNQAVGSVGWRAPECLRGEVHLDDLFEGSISSNSSWDKVNSSAPRERGARLTKAVDLFALGCIYFYVLTNGSHPYGDRYEREVNIVRNEKVNLHKLDVYGEEGHEAALIVSALLAPTSTERPDTFFCLTHPVFWTTDRRLNFLCDASDRFEIMETNPPEPPLMTLESAQMEVIGQSWQKRLDTLFLENLGKHRKYDSRSVKDLLRAMRNKKHHYQDLPENVKRRLGPLPSGFLNYFTSRFPQLFSHVHQTIYETRLRHEPMFASYFALDE